MQLQKLSILFLTVLAVSLNGMEALKEQGKDINWQEREKEYLNWPPYGLLGTKEYWEPLKEGLEGGEIKFASIAHISLDMKLEQGFLAYVGPVEVEGGEAIACYASPLWMYANLVMSKKTKDVYAASSYDDPTFGGLGFKQIEKTLLPKGLEINEKYLPGFMTNPKIVLWYNKWKEGDDFASQFEKISLKNNNEPPKKLIPKDNSFCITH